MLNGQMGHQNGVVSVKMSTKLRQGFNFHCLMLTLLAIRFSSLFFLFRLFRFYSSGFSALALFKQTIKLYACVFGVRARKKENERENVAVILHIKRLLGDKFYNIVKG